MKRIDEIRQARGASLCVGLDPRLQPDEGPGELYRRSMRLVEATARFAACFKPNIAFFEAHGPAGMDALAKLIKDIPDGIPVLLDAKRGDIGTTAEAYAKACFDALGADAVTLSPYLGRDAIDPFLSYPGKAVFVLARTSNPKAGTFQDLEVHGRPLYESVAMECVTWSDRVGLVAAGNDVVGLARVRAAAPHAWILAPGIGAQGGDIVEAWRAGAREDGSGLLPVAARAIADSPDPAAAAEELVARIRGAASTPAEGGARGKTGRGLDLKTRIVRGLVDAGCFKTGSFKLKGGQVSPFYIDLRRVISDPALLAAVAEAYASVSEGASFSRVAGIPAAALPLATAAAMRLGMPMVWPRMPAKDHGTGVRVEGGFEPGERVLLLDDLITTGASKVEAIEILRGEGLVVEDLAVLIERGARGREELSSVGVRLRAFMTLSELFTECERLGVISERERARFEEFAAS